MGLMRRFRRHPTCHMLLRFKKVGFWRSRGTLRRGPWGTGEVENAKSLNYIKQNRLKDTLWKRERPAQMALPPIVTSMPPGTTIKGEGFYVELFLIRAFPLE